MNGFALGLGLKRRLRATRKWAIAHTFPTRIPKMAPHISLNSIIALPTTEYKIQ